MLLIGNLLLRSLPVEVGKRLTLSDFVIAVTLCIRLLALPLLASLLLLALLLTRD